MRLNEKSWRDRKRCNCSAAPPGTPITSSFPIPPTSIHAWRGSTVSTKVDTHQQQREPVEGGVGPVAGA
ncbi:hypothetical protein B9Y72_15170 [Stenotrophomonas maltophilia]|nr:hypothetical protein B9Y68_15170 [Stenotrophomonas maltophilia]PJL18432.1 hypothetical protein B9Y72_15170 [Stenotrophomonas maltophilia]